MNQLRKQRWLIVAMLFFVLISGIGTDVTRISQMDTSDHFRRESLLSTLSSIRTDSPDVCSTEQLGIRVLQPKLEASRPVSFRQDGRQQQLLLLLYTSIIFCFCVFFARRSYEPALNLQLIISPGSCGLSMTRMARRSSFHSINQKLNIGTLCAEKEIIMGTTIVLVIVGVVILGVTIFSFQFSNGGSVSDTETGNETKNGSSK